MPPVRIIIERNSGFGKPVWPENAGFPALSGMKLPYFVPRNASIRSRVARASARPSWYCASSTSGFFSTRPMGMRREGHSTRARPSAWA